MKRKLWLLNLLLLAGIGYTGWQMRQKWLAAREREQALLRRRAQELSLNPLQPLPTVVPVTAANYFDVAQRLLFTRDRNPNVIVEPPPPPPPPKPWPPFPSAHGFMDFGGAPSIILSERAGAPQRSYRLGDTVGPFKILALNNVGITFEWEGKQASKRLDELIDKQAIAQQAAQSNAAPAPAPQADANAAGQSTTNLGTAPRQSNPTGPGIQQTAESRSCQPGDTTPAGTVQDGWRKVVTASPFGQVCRWETAK